MKNIITIIWSTAALILFSCNSGENNKAESDTSSTSKITSTDSSSAKQTIEDPDPTDSIPAEQYGVNTSSKKTAELVRNTLVNDVFKADLGIINAAERRFAFSELDVNGDGKAEIFVGFKGMYFCGTGGCTVLLLNADGKVITRFFIVDNPIVVSGEKTKGWNDLIIESKGIKYLVKWDGSKYPSNPSMQPKYKGLPSDDAARVLDYFNFPYPWFKF